MPRIPDQSISRLRSSLCDDEKILILGASGWFGKTLSSMLIGCRQEVMHVASYPRVLKLEETSINTVNYDFDRIRGFEPTILVDFAFLTREKVAQLGLADFRKTNEKLTHRLLEVAALTSVKKVIFTSSGAAVYAPEGQPKTYEQDPYGYLKNQAERLMESFALHSKKSVLCLRPWSVSGTLVDRPMDYAFSSLIIQALRGQIQLEARRQVFRRYCAVDDMLAVAFALGPATQLNKYTLLESGGELNDLESLANKIVDLIGNGATVKNTIDSGSKPDTYFSDNKSWSASCVATGYTAKDLNTQILESIDYYTQVLPSD